jgi:hypothetical protein
MQEREREIERSIERMIASISEVLRQTEEAAERAQQPVLFDLKAACRFKGVSYDTVRRAHHLQPLCGYYTHWEETPTMHKPRWTREQVERWSEITRPQRIEYVEELLASEDRVLAEGVAERLERDLEREALPEYLREVLFEYRSTAAHPLEMHYG